MAKRILLPLRYVAALGLIALAFWFGTMFEPFGMLASIVAAAGAWPK